jgi:hypothetical protein
MSGRLETITLAPRSTRRLTTWAMRRPRSRASSSRVASGRTGYCEYSSSTSLVPASTRARSLARKPPAATWASTCAATSATLAPTTACVRALGSKALVGLHSREGEAVDPGHRLHPQRELRAIDLVGVGVQAVDAVAPAGRCEHAGVVAKGQHAAGLEGFVLRGAAAARTSSGQAGGAHQARQACRQREVALLLKIICAPKTGLAVLPPLRPRLQAAARWSRSRTPSQSGSGGGCSTQMVPTPAASSSRKTANNSWAVAAACDGIRRQIQPCPATGASREYTATPWPDPAALRPAGCAASACPAPAVVHRARSARPACPMRGARRCRARPAAGPAPAQLAA